MLVINAEGSRRPGFSVITGASDRREGKHDHSDSVSDPAISCRAELLHDRDLPLGRGDLQRAVHRKQRKYGALPRISHPAVHLQCRSCDCRAGVAVCHLCPVQRSLRFCGR